MNKMQLSFCRFKEFLSFSFFQLQEKFPLKIKRKKNLFGGMGDLKSERKPLLIKHFEKNPIQFDPNIKYDYESSNSRCIFNVR